MRLKPGRCTARAFILVAFCGMAEACSQHVPPPSLAIVNARAWTGDTTAPWAEAVAVTGERITAVGTSAEIRRLASTATRIVDARGQMLVPGFIDSHVHFMSGGHGLTSVKLRDAKTKEEFIQRIKAHAATLPPGAWILEGNWDHQNWGGELPRKEWIDSVTPNTPVFVQRLDGHMQLANSAALRAANVTAQTKEGPGGTIVRDGRGEPTGVLKDNAQAFVQRVIPDPPASVEDKALDAAMTYVNEQGVTSIVNMGSWHDLAVFERARRVDRLTTRIYAAVPLASWARLRDTIARARGDAWLRIGGLKGFMDGSLGSHTARMLAGFTDLPSDVGLWVTPPESIYVWTKAADATGLHVAIHAIGDQANRTLLDIYERVERENGARDRRFRIEHAQHLDPADYPRFAKLGVIASMQPYHAIDDGRWADRVIGAERAKGTYAFRSLLDNGARLAFGSDWFVAPPTPIEGIYAAVTRRTLDDRNPGGWVPAQKITVDEALRAYTQGAAYAQYTENEKGMLARGMLADMALIDRDLTRTAANSIRDARIMMTIVGGKVVFERQQPSR